MHICMDWRAINFDWNRARAFLVAAEEGSLSAAARALRVAQPTLGRQVSALEQELGVVLFERVGRDLVLTPSGWELVDHVRAMGEAANQVSLTAAGQSQQIEGSICISASDSFATYSLAPIIGKLRREQPGIEIRVIASNKPSDLRRREADIAIRHFRPEEPDLIARKIHETEAYFYATPDYLREIGNPTTVDGFQHADFMGFDGIETMLAAVNTVGLGLTLRNFPILIDNHAVQWEMVKQSVGIGVMTAEIGDAEPKVERILPDIQPFVVPIWLTTHRELRTSRRVRIVFDFLAEEIGRDRR